MIFLTNIYDSQKFNFLLKFAQVFYIGHLTLDDNRAFCQKQKSTDFEYLWKSAYNHQIRQQKTIKKMYMCSLIEIKRG